MHDEAGAAQRNEHDQGADRGLDADLQDFRNVSRNALTGDGTPLGTMDSATGKGISAEQCAERLFRATVDRELEALAGGKERFAVYAKRLVPSLFSALIRRAKVT